MLKPVLATVAGICVLSIGSYAFAASESNDERNPAKSPFAFGYQTSTIASGISLKLRLTDSVRMQTIMWTDPEANIYSGITEYCIGLRGMRDLGFTGNVSRYAGIGMGYRRTAKWVGSDGLQNEYTSYGITNAQLFVGLEIPWSWLSALSKTASLNTSLEVGMGVVSTSQGIQPKTGVNFGIHYNF